jgi:hypothetical protein
VDDCHKPRCVRGCSVVLKYCPLWTSHRVKGTRRSRAPAKVLLGFFMLVPREANQTHGGTARWLGWASSTRDRIAVPPRFAGRKLTSLSGHCCSNRATASAQASALR